MWRKARWWSDKKCKLCLIESKSDAVDKRIGSSNIDFSIRVC